MENLNFLVLGGPNEGKNVTTVSGVVVRNSFTHYVLADWTTMGRKSQNMGILRHFGPGRALALSGMVVRNFVKFWPSGPPGPGNRETPGF